MISPPADKQEQAFAAHILDLFDSAQEQYTTRFSGFLDARQLALVRYAAPSRSYPNQMFFGGHPDGERVMLGAFSPYEQPDETAFPILPLTILFRCEDTVGHRDLLGSLIALEIRREAVGDILVGEGMAVCFVTETVAPIILGELTKVGHCGVRVEQRLPEVLPSLHHYAELPLNVGSARLDCVLAGMVGISREKSAQMIRAGLVAVNGATGEGVQPLCEGDIVSVRGFGKFLFAEIRATTKKGRLNILCKKYV